ncbi:eIF-5a domain-containing protein [Balamuthia mandrillaris]
MDKRVQQFHTDALKGKHAKTPKEIATLRRFLFKNQNHRFGENEKTRLFSAVQTYYSMYQSSSAPSAAAKKEDSGGENPVVGLLEDALKMPFTVFSTKHKKTMLKWYTELTGKQLSIEDDEGESVLSSSSAASFTEVKWYLLLNIDEAAEDLLTLMDEEDESVVRENLRLSCCVDQAMGERIRSAFQEGKEVVVSIGRTASSADRLFDFRIAK